MALKDFFAIFHRGAARMPILEPNGSFNPVMVQRPLIEAGNTGRYFRDAFQVATNSPVGGGTLPFGNAPGLPRNALSVTTQAVGEQAHGTIPQTPGTSGLVPGFRPSAL